ncbi:FeoA family protein [Desulfoluna spongiiphila]|uniref:Ferrous iron transport protein A n=1 Tax=Desulfoluna spongiiphila TaxID=419481 RepID=A0A1G5H8Z8_9BACT|nr:FeoA family protein [Desulfoluna spongiiphila]SCY60365.1 ferrous iron transport protein A [Desulfoluna spongiiphila]VVS94559.1 transcriptional repressor c-terminal [Desulfoluna spongiiphila]
MTQNSQELSLDRTGTGHRVRIKQLNGGRHFISRATGIGFTPGALVVVLQNYKVGPLIVYLRDTQVAIGRGEARKIIVGKEPTSCRI